MRTILYLMIVLAAAGCAQHKGTRLTLHLIGAFDQRYVVQQVRLNDERQITLDSGRATSNKDSITVDLPSIEPRLYRIVLFGKNMTIVFVNDTRQVDVYCNYNKMTWRFERSPANTEWQNFQKEQLSFVQTERSVTRYMDSLTRINADPKLIDSARSMVQNTLQKVYARNFAFADTVANPGLFLLAYPLIDFGSDYQGLRKFITRVGERFPTHRGIQTLVKNVLDYVDIYSNPLKLGDTLPELTLPDRYGFFFPTNSIKNKYILLNFWSTFCDQCVFFMNREKVAAQSIDSSRFDMISIALDDQKDVWHKILSDRGFTWNQLIDEKMWDGPTARTYRFDSIPFNILIGPDKRIVAKAIPPDSLVQVLSRFIHK